MNRLLRFGTIVWLTTLAATSAPAQTANEDNASIQALLSEVRQLRRAVEKTLSLSPRIQLLLQRAQLQDQKVARISQQLDEVRRRIADQASQQARANERLAKIEEDLSNETDAQRRKQLEDARAAFKAEAGNGPDPQWTAREGELAHSLETEEAALTEFNNKLDALEVELEALPAADGQAPRPR